MRSEIAQDKRAEIAAELVKFVTSTEFRNPIQATIRRTVELQEMIQDEAKTHKRLWERRWNHYQNIQRDTSRIQNNIQLVLHGKEPKTLPRPKKSLRSQRLIRSRNFRDLDQFSNVFDLPGSDSRSQFDALGKSTGADARPPC